MKHLRVFHKKIPNFGIALIRARMSNSFVKKVNFAKILAFKQGPHDLNAEILDFLAASH